MSESKDESKCKCEIKAGPQGYELDLPLLNSTCEAEFRKMVSKMGPAAKRNLAKRIKTDDPKAKEFLKELGLIAR